MGAVLFQFQPNSMEPMSKYFFLGVLFLFFIWTLYGLLKEIIAIRKSVVDFEMVKENNKWYSIKYTIVNGKRRDLGKREII